MEMLPEARDAAQSGGDDGTAEGSRIAQLEQRIAALEILINQRPPSGVSPVITSPTSCVQYYESHKDALGNVDLHVVLWPSIERLADKISTVPSGFTKSELQSTPSNKETEVYLQAFQKQIEAAAQVMGGKAVHGSKWQVQTGMGCRVIDTHSEAMLHDMAPDVSIVRGALLPTPFTIATVFELQANGEENLDDEHKGRAIKYARLLLQLNADRLRAMCWLTNLRVFQVYVAEWVSDRIVVSCTDEQEITAGEMNAWRLFTAFLNCTIGEFGLNTPAITADGRPFTPERLLGSGSFGARVYAGHYHQEEGDFPLSPATLYNQVCKFHALSLAALSVASQQLEVAALQRLALHENTTFPSLVAHDVSTGVIITTPIVDMATPEVSMTAAQVTQLFEGLEILQAAHLVHCDIEPKHIGTYTADTGDKATMAALIDLSFCREVGSPPPPKIRYAGTLFFAADDVLTGLEAEDIAIVPRFHHDTVSLVKSLWALTTWPRYESAAQGSRGVHDISDTYEETRIRQQVKMVRELWSTHFVSKHWVAALDAAAAGALIACVKQHVLDIIA